MRVLVLHNQVAPYRLPIFRELAKRVEVTVLFSESRSPDRLWEAVPQGFRWKILRGKRLGGVILNDPLEIAREVSGSDVVIVAENVDNAPAVLLTLLLARLLGKKTVVWTERIESPLVRERFRGVRRLLKRAYERLIFGLGDVVAAYSRATRRYVLGMTSIGKVVEGVQVYPGELVAPEEPVPLPEEPRKVLYLGYMRPEKGVLELVEAFKRLSIPGAVLILAGTGPLEVPPGKNVRKMGYVSEGAKSFLFRRADFMVLPTRHDPWGLVINESLYHGTPVVTTEAAAGSQIVEHGKNGLVTWDIEGALEFLLTNPKTARKMVPPSRETGEKYSRPEIGARHFFRALERLTGSGRGP